MSAVEVNFDGLVGPTHNYGGLSVGNVASMSHGDEPSNPRAAALQGLVKMRALLRMGIRQGVLPPHERPYVPKLRRFGLTGTDAEVIRRAGREAPTLLRNCASASAMWTANAATVSPSADTDDERVHFTPANLAAMFHRSIEPPFTGRALRAIFAGDPFVHHEPVPGGGAMGDEGAANHTRLAASHGAPGLELFTYGRSAFERLSSVRFLPRQAKEASEAVFRRHKLDEGRTVFVRQSQEAIDAGAFHNDVVGVGNGTVLLYHQKAYERPGEMRAEVTAKAAALGFEPTFIEVTEDELPLEDAISSYLFNSQLVTLPSGRMSLVLPTDAEENEATKAWVDANVGGNGPIAKAQFLDVKQSMANGGGPACLRLRVVLTDEELAAVAPGVLLDEAGIDALEDWVRAHYRDRLTPTDLGDPALLHESREALDALTRLLGLGNLYDFQL
ncbi:N-succinylarginine dihydrolase [Parvularcula dongshanensis]|uniref:N-succinylarginine dihydrolase n=1 Tax=Parvularcula dongshanensis TaxID=1173995 RepID=A0A840HZZ6_9PROT|nr:succinylarginine dihydrolase [Parvularcula dongshanensis]